MKVEEKVINYLKERKKPSSAKQIANHYLINKNYVSERLSELYVRGIVIKVRAGYYRYNHSYDDKEYVNGESETK